MSMEVGLSASRLKSALAEDFETLVDETAAAVNAAPAGHVIDASEEPVRIATAKFRAQVFQRALQLRTQAAQAAFSPSGR